MNKLVTIIDGRVIEIQHIENVKGLYKVIWDNILIGHIYEKITDMHPVATAWQGTTSYVKLYLKELGDFMNAARK
jgi:hypothetical protein